MNVHPIINLKFKIKNSRPNSSRRGQSLLEVIVGLSIGAILIGAGAIAVSSMLRANFTLQKSQGASALNQELMDQVRAFAGASWQNLSVLSRGSSTPYFLVASGSVSRVASGTEGVLDNDISTGLVGYWKFDEATTSPSTVAYDSSGAGNHGTLSGFSNENKVSGVLGAAVPVAPYGGGRYVTVPQTVALSPSTTLSISVWVKPFSYQPDTGSWQTIFEGGGNLNTASGFYLGFNGWSPTFDFLVGSGSAWLTYAQIPQTAIPLNTWTHIVAVFGTSSAYIYVNGGPQYAAGRTAGTAGYESYPTVIGSLSYSPGGHLLDGLIDDLRLYNRALSAAEAKKIFGSNAFTRFFTVEDVCREVGAQGALTGTVPCTVGSVTDPSAQFIAVYTRWQSGSRTGEVKSSDYLTRWSNVVFRQSDWSGGAGATEPLVEPGNRFATSTNIDVTSTGTLRVHIY